jgi:hypothetical protein
MASRYSLTSSGQCHIMCFMCLYLPSGRGGFIAGRTPFDPTACYSKAEEGLSTRCEGQYFVVFYGTAKPIRAPVIEASATT